MDITEAIQTLQTLSDNLSAEITERTTRKAAVDTSILQLQGTLTTNLADLDAATGEIASLRSSNAALSAEVDRLQGISQPDPIL